MAFFNRQIMAHTQILYTGGDSEQGIQHYFTNGLDQKFSSVCSLG